MSAKSFKSARVPAKKIKNVLAFPYESVIIAQYLQNDSPENVRGFLKWIGRSLCGAGCGHTLARFDQCCAADGQEMSQTSENLSCQKLRFCNHPRNL
jgi:hypothetical protein